MRKHHLQVVHSETITDAPETIPHGYSHGFNPTLYAIHPMTVTACGYYFFGAIRW